MVDTKSPGDKTLSVPTKTLTLKPRVEQGTVRQSFSHGRTKLGVVETRGKRRIGGDAWRARRRQRGRRTGRWCCGLGLGLAETLLGFEFGLALGFLILPVTFFLGLAAGFGGFTLGLLDAFPAVAALGFLFRDAALFDVAHLRIRQRTGARGALILGQRAQDHA
jgi:hypothetical protein